MTDMSTKTVADLLDSDDALTALAEAMRGWQQPGRNAARQALLAASEAFDRAPAVRTEAAEVVGWCHICNRDIRQAHDHAPGCQQSGFGPEHPEIAPAKPYRCTVLIEMPADDGKNVRPDEVVAWMQGQGIELVQWHDEDLVGGEER